ncbi:hypothetical protein MKEN_01289100 [Mycena kentingensis (nom. inval.)]|nr:hypothetical protein MKEN_01289100 [Mycena kentingensis (nom. inval.)]
MERDDETDMLNSESTPEATRSIYALTRTEITRGVANRFVHSRTYVALYLTMAALSVVTVVLSLTDGCPGLAFYILEVIINTAMILEVGIRFVAFGRQFWKSPFNVVDLILTVFCALTLLVLAFAKCGTGSKEEELLDTFLLIARNILQFGRLAAVMRQSGQSIFSRPKPIDINAARRAGFVDLDLESEEDEELKSPSADVYVAKTTKFNNTLASAIGFGRPKKTQPPPLTIRSDTLSAPLPQRRPYTAPSSPGMGSGRPPSNSVSSSRSRGDSLEPSTPKTPEDAVVRRGSLLTLSDTDPFAARVVSIHSPSDPNRLSAYSREQKSPVDGLNRVSYASSSSQSFRMSPRSPVSDAGSALLVDKKSTGSLRRKDSAADNRYSQPDPPPKPRPAMRARGLTDVGMERAPFLRTDSFSRGPAPNSPASSYNSPTSPSRKLSQRTAPPTGELPSPPSPDIGGLAEWRPLKPRNSRNKASPEPESKASESAWEPDPQPRTHRTLKKSMSQQSLNKYRMQAAASPPGGSNSPLPDSTSSSPSLGPRKQRSFHRLPVQAIPLQLPLSEQRAEPSQRKRLFSTSSGRRPSQSTLALDDARSIPDSDRVTLSASSSGWIDADQGPRTPTSTAHESLALDARIMSPAEMREVEARVDAEYHARPRNGSIMSASTTALSDLDHEFGVPSVSSFGGGRKRSNSEHPSLRSTSTSSGLDMYYYASPAPEPPTPPILMSLPPPPRRTKSRTSSVSSRTPVDLLVSPVSSRSQPDVLAPLSPPPRKLRPKISQDKRQSLMRKPSFLEFEDEVEKEPLPPPPPPHVMLNQDSFLDLTRESFDSSRSDESF